MKTLNEVSWSVYEVRLRILVPGAIERSFIAFGKRKALQLRLVRADAVQSDSGFVHEYTSRLPTEQAEKILVGWLQERR